MALAKGVDSAAPIVKEIDACMGKFGTGSRIEEYIGVIGQEARFTAQCGQAIGRCLRRSGQQGDGE